MFVEWDDRTHRVERPRRWNDHPWALESLMVNLVGLWTDEFSLPHALGNERLPGDWIIRRGATPEQKLASLQKILAKTSAAFTADKKLVKRDVIVAHGTFSKDDFPDGIVQVSLAEDGNNVRQNGEAKYYFRQLGDSLGKPIVNEWKGCEAATVQFSIANLHLTTLTKPAAESRRADVLDRIGVQMKVSFTQESREMETWVITPN